VGQHSVGQPKPVKNVLRSQTRESSFNRGLKQKEPKAFNATQSTQQSAAQEKSGRASPMLRNSHSNMRKEPSSNRTKKMEGSLQMERQSVNLPSLDLSPEEHQLQLNADPQCRRLFTHIA